MCSSVSPSDRLELCLWSIGFGGFEVAEPPVAATEFDDHGLPWCGWGWLASVRDELANAETPLTVIRSRVAHRRYPSCLTGLNGLNWGLIHCSVGWMFQYP